MGRKIKSGSTGVAAYWRPSVWAKKKKRKGFLLFELLERQTKRIQINYSHQKFQGD